MAKKINFNEILKKLEQAQSKYSGAIGDAEQSIADIVEFEIAIIYHESDGWNLLSTDTADVAPLNSCLSVIKEKGTLSFEDFKKRTI